MSKSKIIWILALPLVPAATTLAQTVASKADEGKLIAALKSNDATHKERVDACRQLAIVGTEDAIPALAALLADEKLSHMARYALEPMPSPAVDKVLRQALGKLEGLQLVGVIGSIGVRRDAQAVEPLKKVLMGRNAGPEVSRATMRAMGSIGTPAAADALQAAMAQTQGDARLHLYEGLFRCAGALAAEGHRAKAVEIYDQLRDVKGPHQVRGGALRGAILARGNDGLALLERYLRSDDYILFSAAVQTSLEMSDARVTGILADALKRPPADHQVVITKALGLRGDSAALPALSQVARTEATSVRVAAIRALAEIQDGSAVPTLVALLATRNQDVAGAAEEALAALPGREADRAVMAMFEKDIAGDQLTALELMGRRRMITAVSVLLKAVGEADPGVRPEIIKKVGELGSPAELPALLDLLGELRASQDLNAIRQALGDVCSKAKNPESCTGQLIARLNSVEPAQKIVLLRVLSGIGGRDALKAVRKAVDDSNHMVHTAAIRALGAWPSADAAPHLLDLAKAAEDAGERTLCLRSYLSLAGRRDLPVGQRLSMCREAAEVIERDDEKKMLLGTLSGIEAPATLALITPHLDSAATRQEATIAALRVAENLLKQRNSERHAPKLIEPLEQVTQVATGDLARRAKTLLRQARNKADGN
jgi:HEAT repeat protein